MLFKVQRYDPETKTSRLDSFVIGTPEGMTVLDALFRIQEQLDPSLSFRYSCRGAVCGSCAMLINKVPRLACRTQVAALFGTPTASRLKPWRALEARADWRPRTEVLVEPLPNLPVLKDLVVDMTRFFDHWRVVEPALKPAQDPPDKEYPMTPAQVAELELYTNCILCAACFGACPVNDQQADYLGPAALAKLYRFFLDPREGENDPRLLLAHNPEGWWACQFHTNCRQVCPRGVPPNIAIGQARARLRRLGKKPLDSLDHD
ncbi:MAG TPA: succinate dehydrogenase/fumarate reductase iron-sulfur subunit [candidate division WOR-3 bacterium]|uniref:succinate dehydrogenase n=1 Tax=candidate division WOR-3 bacterium TaxID=2052148 RepID=A0A7V0XEJ8_UNCW3|nr:succinate dehydrogenase/fumarate reductase iron-sulfur subunit [candidate division WOR-3 bacterium]